MSASREEKKAYLMRYLQSKKDIARKLDDIRTLRSRAMMRARTFDGTPKSTDKTDFSDYAAALDELVKKYDAEMAHSMVIMNEVISAIHRLDDGDDINLLFYRYIRGYKQKEVAKAVGFNETYICHRMKTALDRFEIPNENEIDERGFIINANENENAGGSTADTCKSG